MEETVSEVEDRRKEIMVLSDIALIVDCPHSTAPDEGEGYPLIRTPNIGKGRLLLDGVHRVSKEVYDLRNKRIIPQENDILFAREAPAGNAAIISGGQQVCMGQRTVLIRPDLKKVNPHYLVYYILAPKQQSRLLGYSHGATVGHVNIPDIKNLEINIPELTAQNKIANILMTLDECVENNNKRIKILEQMAENLYKEWFVRFRFPEHEDVEFEGGIPKGWKICFLQDVFSFQEGPGIRNWQYVDSDGINFINIRCISNGDIKLDAASMISKDEAYGKYSHFMLKENDIVMSCSGTLGRSAIVRRNHLPLCLNTSVIRFWPKLQQEDFSFLYGYLTSSEFINRQREMASGSAQVNFGPVHLKKIRLLLPDEAVRRTFNDVLMPILDEEKTLRDKNLNLEKQRDLLLPRLMSGKLQVK